MILLQCYTQTGLRLLPDARCFYHSLQILTPTLVVTSAGRLERAFPGQPEESGELQAEARLDGS